MNILDKLIINIKQQNILLDTNLKNTIKFTCNDIFKKLNLLDKERLIYLAEYLIYIINSKFNIINFSQWYLNKNRDIKGIFLLLLPYIDYNLLESLVSINKIAFTEKIGKSKHEDYTILNNDIFKKPRDEMKYLTKYSNIGLGFIKNTVNDENILTDNEDVFPYKIIENKFLVLLETLNIINGKLYVNWINIFPISLEEYKETEIYKNTNLIEYNNINYKGLYIGDFYNILRNKCYENIKQMKWLLFCEEKTNNYLIQKLNSYINLNDILNNEFIVFKDLSENEKNKFRTISNNINDTKLLKEILFFFINHTKNNLEPLKFKIINKFLLDDYDFIEIEEDIEIDTDNIEESIIYKKNNILDSEIKLCFNIIKENYIDIFWNYLKNMLDKFKNTIFGRILIEKNNGKYNITNNYYYKDSKLNLKNIYNIAKSLSHTNEWQLLTTYYITLELSEKNDFIEKIHGSSDFNLNLQNNLKIQFEGMSFNYEDKIIELKSNFKKYIKDFIFEELITTGVLSQFKNREQFDNLFKYLSILFENKKWEECYYYLTNDKYKNLKIDKISYFKALQKQYWMSFFAMDWISQIGFFNHFIFNQVIYSTGATGQGKSTQVPKLLLYSLKAINYKDDGKIICSQPRIGPTVENALRIALELGLPIENEKQERLNNYSVQFKHQNDKHKNNSNLLSLLICTDGILYNVIKNNITMFEKNEDKYINQCIYDIIIVDEAHEHNTNMDLILTLARSTCLLNNKIKLAIVSATMDDDEQIYRRYYNIVNDNLYFPRKNITNILENRTIDFNYIDRRYHISPPGETTQYKITEIYLNKNLTPDEAQEEGHKTIINICKNSIDGDILFFCNGQEDILDSVQYLNINTPADVIALPFFSRMNNNYKNIINKIEIFKYKLRTKKKDVYTNWNEKFIEDLSVQNNIYKRVIIIATNVAEASITLPDLRYVVDNGYTKVNVLDNIFDTQKLIIDEIAESSRLQRKGRVGRVADGTVYYMYKKDARINNKTKYKITQQDNTENIISLLNYDDNEDIIKKTDNNLITGNFNSNIKKFYNNDLRIDTNTLYNKSNLYNIHSQNYNKNSSPILVYLNNIELSYYFFIKKGGFTMNILNDIHGLFYIIHPLENNIKRNILNNIIQDQLENTFIESNTIRPVNLSRIKKKLYDLNLLIDYNNNLYISKNNFEIINKIEYKTEFGNILTEFKSIESINDKILLLHSYGLNIEVEISELLLLIKLVGNNINKIFIEEETIYNLDSDILFLYNIIKKIKSNFTELFSKREQEFYIQKNINEFKMYSEQSLNSNIKEQNYNIEIWNALSALKRNGELEKKYKSVLIKYDKDRFKNTMEKYNIEKWCIKNNLNYELINELIIQMYYLKYNKKIKKKIHNLNLNYSKLLFKNTIEEKILFCFVLSNYNNLCIHYEDNNYIFNKHIINKSSKSKTLTNFSNNFVFVYDFITNDDKTITFSLINKINLQWVLSSYYLFYNPKYFSYYDLILDPKSFDKTRYSSNYEYMKRFISNHWSKNLILWNTDKTPLSKRYYTNVYID